MKTRSRRIAALSIAAIAAVAGSNMLVRASIPQVNANGWAAGGEVSGIPEGAAAVALPDGRLVVAGGQTAGGEPIDTIAIYDPSRHRFSAAGSLNEARSGHAAVLLNDGRVLFAGGRTAQGPTFSVEIFSVSGSSRAAGNLMLPRVDHAAATLRDGRVLIVGGSDGSQELGMAELFDPKSGDSQAVADTPAAPRVKATATTLLDGHVLVAGGRVGGKDVASAELFNPARGTFEATGSMTRARSGHVAVLLPNNNQVLIAGGSSSGEAVASAELFSDWNDRFTATKAMSGARTGAVAGGLLPHDVAIVAGGGADASEYFGYATVKTDKDDYAPGEIVTITGSGWQPGEKVTLKITEDADSHFDFVFTAVADEAGNIVNNEFFPRHDEEFQHIGMRFYLLAAGAASQALNTFTDGDVNVKTNGIKVTLTSRLFSSTTCASGTHTGATTDSDISSTITKTFANVSSGSIRLSVPASLTVGSTTHQFTGWVGSANFSASTPEICVAATNPNRTYTANYAAQAAATTSLSVGAASGVYGGTTNLSATLTSGGSGVSGKTVSFTLNGASAGSATTNSSGVATITGASLGTIAPGTYAPGTASGVAASFAGDSTHSATSGSNTLAVNKADQTITFAALANKTYGDAAFTVSATASSSLAVSFAASGACTISGSTVTITGAESCTVTASQAGNANYNAATDVPRSFSIGKASATLTLSTLEHTYDGSPKSATVTTGPADLSGVAVTYDGSTTVPSDVGRYAVVAKLTNVNYTAEEATGTLVIAKANQTITFAELPARTFGNAPFALVASAASGLPVSFQATGTCALSGATLTITGAGACSVTASQAGNGNYNAAQSVVRSFSIAKAKVLVTLGSLKQKYTGTQLSPTATTSVPGLRIRWNNAPQTNGGKYAVTAEVVDDNYEGSSATSEAPTATFHIEHDWSGVLQPVNVDGSSRFKSGSTIPVKFQLTNGSSPLTTLAAKVAVGTVSSAVTGAFDEAVVSTAADAGNTFRYDPVARQYIFNLSTKGWAEGTYVIRIDLRDETMSRTVNVSVRR